MLACAAGHVDVITALCEAHETFVTVRDAPHDAIMHFLDLTAVNNDGDTALHLAARSARPDAIRVLHSRSIAHTLLEDWRQIHAARNSAGLTPLELAMQGGDALTIAALHREDT